MNNIQEAIQSIHQTTDQIIEAVQPLEANLIEWKPADEVWSIMEVLCHVEEATPYWLNEIKQVAKTPGVEWGRGLQHEGRLAAVASAPHRSLDAVLEGIRNSKEMVQNVLGSLEEQDLTTESPSRNPRFGTKPLIFIIEHLLVEHLDKHLKQIERNIHQYSMKQTS
ncbi:DinB family protein [Ammoniphilus sp. 3BR4]|uniref:DinB family protein n=1 Tax=Ammoniphilus sp. 3BR4 TaxID=3158265 RepID=UPI003466D044